VSLTIHGIGVSKGIAIGKVYVIDHDVIEVSEYTLAKHYLDDEVARFEGALEVARGQLNRIREHLPPNTSPEVAEFIDTHLLMLDDSLLAKAPIQVIYERQCNAEWALKLQCDQLVKVFEEMDDPYLRARKHDVEHVVARVQRILRGYTDFSSDVPGEHFANAVVLADDLSPADTIVMQHHGILAFATEHGGTTSHTAILARSLGIPAVVGLRHARRYVKHDDVLVVDGERGIVLIDPDERSLIFYHNRQQEHKRQRAKLAKIREAPTETRDGTPINLQVNIEFPEDMAAVSRVGGDGVGLYRTEFLFMNRDTPPNEEEHYQAYQKVLQSIATGEVTIRTFDLGADKEFDDYAKPALCANPALGLRGIRLSLHHLQHFIAQLRAILRVSALYPGQIRLLVPMVCSFQELAQVRDILTEVRTALTRESIEFDPDIPFGAMIEVPAMAICSDLFVQQVDFLSIGTNDLIQYTLAIDRGDDTMNYLYNPLHPAVLKLIKMSIDASNKAGKSISMCGEMASDTRYVRLLLGLGLRTFSVNPEAFLEVKQIINNTQLNVTLTRQANKLLKTVSQLEMQRLLDHINA